MTDHCAFLETAGPNARPTCFHGSQRFFARSWRIPAVPSADRAGRPAAMRRSELPGLHEALLRIGAKSPTRQGHSGGSAGSSPRPARTRRR
jgi:hypothetical protein